jgi:tetratricopeptide (TPR) repeat protein
LREVLAVSGRHFQQREQHGPRRSPAAMPEDARPGSARAPLDVARQAFSRGDLEAAERALVVTLGRQPEHGAALYLLGCLRLQQGQPQPAVSLLERARDQDPASADVLVALGTAYQATGRPAEAAAALRLALEQQPGSLDATLALMEALAAGGDRRAARALLAQARRLAPADPQVLAAEEALRQD